MNYLPSQLGRGWPETLWKGPALTKMEKMHKHVGTGQRVRMGNEQRKENPGWTITRAGEDAEDQNQLCWGEVGLGDDTRRVKQ